MRILRLFSFTSRPKLKQGGSDDVVRRRFDSLGFSRLRSGLDRMKQGGSNDAVRHRFIVEGFQG